MASLCNINNLFAYTYYLIVCVFVLVGFKRQRIHICTLQEKSSLICKNSSLNTSVLNTSLL